MGLRVLLVGGPMYEGLYGRISEFEGAEGVEVERVVARDHPDLNARISGEFSSGNADYDLVSTHTKYAPSQRRWLAPLDEIFDQKRLAPFSQRTIELAKIGGELFSVPRNLDVKLLHYRTDLIESPPATWDELLEVAARIKSGGTRGEDGFAFPGKESGLFGHFYELHAMHGGEMFGDEGDPVPRFRDEAGKAALRLLVELCRRAAPEDTPDWHYDEVAECFRSGRAAMSTDWPGGFHVYDGEGSKVRGRYGLAMYSEGPAGRFVYGGCHSFAVPKTAKDPSSAARLLEFLTSRESQLYEARLGTLPARTDALRYVMVEAGEGTFAEKRWKLLEETEKAAIIPPKHERYPAVEDAVWRGIREAIVGRKSVADALRDAEKSAGLAAKGVSG